MYFKRGLLFLGLVLSACGSNNDPYVGGRALAEEKPAFTHLGLWHESQFTTGWAWGNEYHAQRLHLKENGQLELLGHCRQTDSHNFTVRSVEFAEEGQYRIEGDQIEIVDTIDAKRSMDGEPLTGLEEESDLCHIQLGKGRYQLHLSQEVTTGDYKMVLRGDREHRFTLINR